MRSMPVGSFAPGTAQEQVFILVNILRNKVPRCLSGDAIARFIAFGTSGEGIEVRFKGEGGEQLCDLFLYKVTMDEQMVRGQGPITERLVPRQDHAVLFQRKSDDPVVIQCPVVEDIEPQEPHPLREPAQHDISDEFHINQRPATKTRRREERR